MLAQQESIWLATLGDAHHRELYEPPCRGVLVDPDLLVLGGGLVDLATAYFAAECGLRVQVISESRPALDAECSLGCIIPNACGWQFSSNCHSLAQASRDWWAKLAVRPEFQLDWRVTGALMVDERRLAPSPRQHMLAALEAGYSVHDVDAEQIALLEPQLAPCPSGGLHYPSEAVLNPLRAACGLIRGLRQRGGQIAVGGVTGRQFSGGRLTEIQTEAGSIRPKAIFSADLGLLRKILGDEFSLGHILPTTHRVFLASAPQPPLLRRPILDTCWVVQLRTGEVVIESQVSGEVEDETRERILAPLRQRLPALHDVEFSRVWTGTSQRTPDATPIVDKVSGLENAWYCGGLDFASVLFAPIIGRLVVDWMRHGQPAEELAAFAKSSR